MFSAEVQVSLARLSALRASLVWLSPRHTTTSASPSSFECSLYKPESLHLFQTTTPTICSGEDDRTIGGRVMHVASRCGAPSRSCADPVQLSRALESSPLPMHI